MSLSSAAFFCENFAGTVSVLSGAPGTASAPLTNTSLLCGFAAGACELGSSLPAWPEGVCCAFSCCSRCCPSAAGGGCCATAMLTPPRSASTSEIACKGSRRIVVSFGRLRAINQTNAVRDRQVPPGQPGHGLPIGPAFTIEVGCHEI